MKEIEMLANFDNKGIPHPFRFRLVAEDESLVVVNIDKILFQEENKRDNIIKLLNKASNFIERELSKRIEIRKMPDITFVYDESLEYALNIENIIESIDNNE